MSKLKIILLFVLALRADSLHNGLEGKHLNVMTLHVSEFEESSLEFIHLIYALQYPPMIVIKDNSGQKSFSGPLIQQLQWLSVRLKFK